MTETVIDPTIPPSGPGCADCAEQGGWWLHLRRCALCGHIGCCDTSPSQHATRHWQTTGHPVIRSYEPDEDWFYDFPTQTVVAGPDLAPPLHRPREQGSPAPQGRVPADWRQHLH